VKRCILVLAGVLLLATPAHAAGPKPGSPEYIQRDLQNIDDAYGRIIGPGGQVQNPNYFPALQAEGNEVGLTQLAEQFATPTRLAITPGQVFPGWNAGNPLRRGWNDKRGQLVRVKWTNRYGALIRGFSGPGGPGGATYGGDNVKPVVPGLGIQSEYAFSVNPYTLSGGSSITPSPIPPDQAPDPKREEKTGFDAWRKAGLDTMVVVPRASTHLEYTDISYALPASRYGQALASVYVQA
jgi:hypothetical protein